MTLHRGDRDGRQTDFETISRHRLAERKGQSLVEFALVLPILLLVVVGILEFGIAFRTFQVVTNAAREGARTAVVGAEPAQVRGRVEQYLNSGGLDLGADGADFVFRCEPPSNGPAATGRSCRTGEIARVEIVYPISFVILRALIEPTFGPPAVTSVSQMRTE